MRVKGTVEWFDMNKGFGVVRAEDGTTHRFRWRDIMDGRLFKGLKENDDVEFEPAVDRSGRDVANDVVLTKKASYRRPFVKRDKMDDEGDTPESTVEQDVD